MRALLAAGRLLLTLEEAGSDFVGRLPVQRREDGGLLGQVFADRGRLRWAEASGFTTRLLPSLAEAAGVGLPELQRQLRLAAEEGGAVEDSLPRILGLGEEPVRRAFLHHTASVVDFLAREAASGRARLLPPEAAPLPESREGSAFTPLEILAEIFTSAAEDADPPPPLPRVFTDCGPDHRLALCFLELREPFFPGLPVSLFGPFEGGLLAALDLMRQARRLQRGLYSNDERSAPFAGVVKAGDRGWAVTYEPPYLCLFRLGSAGEYGRILTQYRRDRRDRRDRSAASASGA